MSALFMFPTGVIFPALLRAANTPPASKTLEMAARRDQPDEANYDLYDQLQREQDQRDADFQSALKSGECCQHFRMELAMSHATVGFRFSQKPLVVTFVVPWPFSVPKEVIKCVDDSSKGCPDAPTDRDGDLQPLSFLTCCCDSTRS